MARNVLPRILLSSLLIGSFVWGTLGDRRGRVRALYGSLLLYSLATLANAAVGTLAGYAACRFLAGLGLAGELGAAITLVSETLSTERRGLGTTLVAGCGLCGGIAAAALAVLLPWRTCYVVGGASGLILLALRVQLLEPALYRRAVATAHGRGSLRLLFRRPARVLAYGRLILIGLPIWFVAGILMLLSPEFAAALGVGSAGAAAGPGAGVTAAKAVLYSYIGAALGDFACGLLSQKLRSRKRALFLSLLAVLLGILIYLHAAGISTAGFYFVCFLVGLTTGNLYQKARCADMPLFTGGALQCATCAAAATPPPSWPGTRSRGSGCRIYGTTRRSRSSWRAPPLPPCRPRH